MPGNPLVRFDEGRVGRTARCRLLSYSTENAFFPFCSWPQNKSQHNKIFDLFLFNLLTNSSRFCSIRLCILKVEKLLRSNSSSAGQASACSAAWYWLPAPLERLVA